VALATLEEGAGKSLWCKRLQPEVLGKNLMWLKFGVSSDNALVCIEDIPSGKTALIAVAN